MIPTKNQPWLCVPPKVLRLGDIGSIIISREEITCSCLVDSKLVSVTGYSCKFTSKLARYRYYRAHERNLSAKVTMGLGTAIIGIIIAVITTLLGG
jgi:hypothetical protein